MVVKYSLMVCACAASLAAATPALADPTIDFSIIGTNNTSLGASQTFDGVAINAYTGDGTTFTPSVLWERHDGVNDDGLGVCSEGTSACSTGGGDVNELSNQHAVEWIVLTLPTNKEWDQVWLSSLDNNGGSPNEKGTIYLSNTLSISGADVFGFQHGVFTTSDNGDIENAIGFSFNAFAKYLIFRAGSDGDPAGEGRNNDYLIWGVTLADCQDCGTQNTGVPEPVTLALFGAGLAGAAVLRRRRRAPA